MMNDTNSKDLSVDELRTNFESRVFSKIQTCVDEHTSVLQASEEIVAMFEAHYKAERAEAEQRVADWFAEGVPMGFTVQSWLAVARTTFDDEGKPTTHKVIQPEELATKEKVEHE